MKTIKTQWKTPTILQTDTTGVKTKRNKVITKNATVTTDFDTKQTKAMGTKTVSYTGGKKAGTTKVKPMSTRRALNY
jgi:hypothetical protein